MRIFLLLLLACSSSKPPPDCAHACEHVLDLMQAQLEDHLARAADHSDPTSAADLRATSADQRDVQRVQCLARCTPASAACEAAASSVEAAEACLP